MTRRHKKAREEAVCAKAEKGESLKVHGKCKDAEAQRGPCAF